MIYKKWLAFPVTALWDILC